MKRLDVPMSAVLGNHRKAQRMQRLVAYIEKMEAKGLPDDRLDSYYAELERRLGSKPGRAPGVVVNVPRMGG